MRETQNFSEQRSASRSDPLPLVPQRKAALESLDSFLNTSSSEQFTSLMILDVRDFREFNFSFGEAGGDAILQAIMKRLRNIDDADAAYQVFYLGNDEFAVIISHLNSPGFAVLHAEKILNLFKQVFEWNEHTLKITVNCGIAYNYDAHSDAAKLLYDAEIALAQAKTLNQPCQMLGKQDQQQSDQLKWELLNSLHQAMQDDELTLYYQPKVPLRKTPGSSDSISAEALIRWQNKTHGLMSPAITLPLIEHLGTETDLIRWMINTALKKLHEEQSLKSVSINVPAKTVTTPALQKILEEALNLWPVENGQLTLEITEDILIFDKERAFDCLSKIRELGVRIAIDDFGTGYSSLAYFKHIPADELKIDQAFIKNMLHSKDDCNIVKLIIELAHMFNLQVVAEGVEDAATLNLLKTLGCDCVQGFYISKPLPYNEYIQWLGDQ